jgi:hypothetical protein
MVESTEKLEVTKVLDELDSFLNQYELANNINLCESDVAVYESLNFSQEQLMALTNEEALTHSYLIQTYISKLTHDHNKEVARLDWATNAFKDLLHHYLPITTFEDYTKYETKEQIICDSYPVANKLREIMRKSHTICTLYNNKFPPLGKTADILFQLARTR